MLARKSITFNIDDVDEVFHEKSKDALGESFIIANHTKALADFGVPPGWQVVHKSEREWMYNSPSVGSDVYGLVIRFEKK